MSHSVEPTSSLQAIHRSGQFTQVRGKDRADWYLLDLVGGQQVGQGQTPGMREAVVETADLAGARSSGSMNHACPLPSQ